MGRKRKDKRRDDAAKARRRNAQFDSAHAVKQEDPAIIRKPSTLVAELWAAPFTDQINAQLQGQGYFRRSPHLLFESMTATSWREKGMHTYRFDPDFLAELTKSSFLDIFPDVMQFMPYPSVYMLLPHESMEGIFCMPLPWDEITRRLGGCDAESIDEVLGMMDPDRIFTLGTAPSGNRVIGVRTPETSEMPVVIIESGNGERRWLLQVQAIPKRYEMMHDDVIYGVYDVETVVAALSYLCSKNADDTITYRAAPYDRDRKPSQSNMSRASSTTIHDVGYHIGAALRRQNVVLLDGTTEAGDGPKRSVRPHWRRGHLHHYWIGPLDKPEERRLVVRWVDATFVHGTKGADETVPTIHPVR